MTDNNEIIHNCITEYNQCKSIISYKCKTYN